MDYLIISLYGLSLFQVPSLAKRNEVGKIYMAKLGNPNLKELAKDIENVPGWEKFSMVNDPFEVINKHTTANLTIVIDDVGWGEFAESMRNKGWKVVGGSPITDKLEDDRTYGTKLFSKIMKVPESTTFTSFEDGIKWLKGKEKTEKFVFKPHDSMVPKEYTYVSKDITDLVEAMTTFKSKWEWTTEYQLQEFVEGPLVDFGAWFNGEDWLIDSHYIYFENKPFLVDDKGPATGGEVALVFYKKNEGKFFEVLEKLKPFLQKTGYVGQISVNSIVSAENKEPYFLELTPRFGYPSFPQDITCLEDNDRYLHDLYQALVNKDHRSLFALNKPCVVCVVSTPPYPNSDPTGKAKGIPISWDKEYNWYFYPYGVKYDLKKKKLVCVSDDGLLLNVTCIDTTVDGAVEMLYEKYIKSIQLKDKQYRTDAGKDAKKRIKNLKEWKLI